MNSKNTSDFDQAHGKEGNRTQKNKTAKEYGAEDSYQSSSMNDDMMTHETDFTQESINKNKNQEGGDTISPEGKKNKKTKYKKAS